MDLSFPRGRCVNAGIPRRQYLGVSHAYSLPSVSEVGDRLKDLGHGAYMWSANISRAYRQLRADPLSTPLFSITYRDEMYIDIALPFGCHSSGAACVCVTKAIAWMMKQEGYFAIVYVDDFLGAEGSFLLAQKAFDNFMTLGVELAKDKCYPPCVRLTWLGFDINITDMRISIPVDKMNKVLEECDLWL